MLISLKWIRDYVDLPADLAPCDLGERFTLTTAEVEEVIPVSVGAYGLIVARIESIAELPGAHNLRQVVLNVGNGKTVESVTAAPALHVGANVVYAPPGASVAAIPEIGTANVAGKTSIGMILPGDSLGVPMAVQEAILLNDAMQPGEDLPPDIFDDWLIEVDNKSITHRPDLWGHYGIAREIAAVYRRPLKPYPVTPLEELTGRGMPEIPIVIADPDACPRYCGIVLTGVPTVPAPLWMQLRVGRVGMRPISGLVDLTNYVMADLGQPMHAFDAAKVDRIEVDWAKDGERFRTLDGVERNLTSSMLMIQRGGESIALAGVMGGLATEVSDATTALLLESANFNPAAIRKTATRLGLRTDASARFEKSLDPGHARLAIQRFIHLAGETYPDIELESRLSDGYPKPLSELTVTVNPRHVARTIGREVPSDEASRLLAPLGFELIDADSRWQVRVPSFRATGDVSIEDDVIEEIARMVGYNAIESALPRISMRRFEVNALHELEQRSLEYFTSMHAFNEIQGYLWYDAAWLRQLDIDPGRCVELRNPASDGLHQLRRTLMPNMLAAVVKNRFYFPEFSIVELGGVFEKGGGDTDEEFRHIGLVSAKRGKRDEDELYRRLKGAIEGWAWRRFTRPVAFSQVAPVPDRPWEHPQRTAGVSINGKDVGRISVIDRPLRRVMDEHLAAWCIVWAELRLSGLENLDSPAEPLGAIPEHPVVEMDFSFLVPVSTRYAEVVEKLAVFHHPLLKQLRFVDCYQGEQIQSGQRSLTIHTVCGEDTRTLVEEDTNAFRRDLERHLAGCGYEIRR